jgi:alpha(1,3/1,4) fucosyltransferase
MNLGQKKLNIHFCGSISSWGVKEFNSYKYTLVLQECCDLSITDAEHADLFFVNETLSSRKDYFKKMRSDTPSILISREALSPDFNLFDYAIGFDPIIYSDRYLRFNTGYRFQSFLEITPSKKFSFSEKKFCDFIYSNSLSNPMRDEIKLVLDKHATVDSYGRHLNNAGNLLHKLTSKIGWERAKIDIQAAHLFSIAAENAFQYGYTSEKIYTSFAAGNIPIYWGNPLIFQDVNPNRIISAHSFQSIEKMYTYIASLAKDEDAYNQIIQEPWFTNSQLAEIENYPFELQRFLQNIVDQPADLRIRRNSGTFSNRYVTIISSGFQFGEAIRIIKELKHWQSVPLRLYLKIKNKISRKFYN